MKKISILGSTGSVGRSTLSLADLNPDRFRIVGLAARRNAARLLEQAQKYTPLAVALHDREQAAWLRQQLPGTPVLEGQEGVSRLAAEVEAEIVVAAITGAAGLIPTLAAVRAGRDVALANKETLVMAGELVMREVRDAKVRLLPVDSEHSAIHQCLNGERKAQVKRILLTASGGPFFGKSLRELSEVTVQQALNHPTWKMGPKITVDSATLMNKGLEVIEAHHLFGLQPGQVDIVIHPQSMVHSMVEFVDGAIMAQLGITDMRLPVGYALSYPDRCNLPVPSLDLFALRPLEFHPPDPVKFPCLRLAEAALQQGRTYPAALNAANEVAVGLFLEEQIPFPDIPAVIEGVLDRHRPRDPESLEVVLEVDRRSRLEARDLAVTRM